MKAIAYINAHSLSEFALKEITLPDPAPGSGELLVRVKAASVNPVDFKQRSSRSGTEAEPVILGWDAAGTVEAKGPGVSGFEVGDRVYYAGNITRPGSYAELQCVDHRIAAKMPSTLGFAQAAALPLTGLTAWEALFEKMGVDRKKDATVMIWGGAGGVGSIATQLLKARTDAFVIATASRPETAAWCSDHGADLVVDHHGDVPTQLADSGHPYVDFVFGTTGSESAAKSVRSILKPMGHWALIDDPGPLDFSSFKSKSLSLHWELMFTKSRFDHDAASQGQILSEIAVLIDSGKIRSTLSKTIHGLSPASFKEAHSLLETGKTIGKIVIEY